MSVLKSILKPTELSALLKLKFKGKYSTPIQHETTFDNRNFKYCFDTLDAVSRSFAAVIRELPEELSANVCLFYLILRALDSIEDDMELDKELKLELLRSFHLKTAERGWHIHHVGDKPEYRELLANFDKVTEAFATTQPKYQKIILDICKKMGDGMADFIELEVSSVEDYNLYCHHVAGLVGIGLSQIFSASEIESKAIQQEVELANSMGLFLQKTNIVRDYFEDIQEKRIFWPREIWSQYGEFVERFALQPNHDSSLACLNHMVNNALEHTLDCLAYLQQLKDKRVFRFCAIPQVMAIATLAKVYNNPEVFQKNVKIRKGYAAKLILKTNTVEDVLRIYNEMASVIEKKITPHIANSEETFRLVKHIQSFCTSEVIPAAEIAAVKVA